MRTSQSFGIHFTIRADKVRNGKHDYSDDPKGFILWKDLLEETLF